MEKVADGGEEYVGVKPTQALPKGGMFDSKIN